jgi:hypothetical protein
MFYIAIYIKDMPIVVCIKLVFNIGMRGVFIINLLLGFNNLNKHNI